MTKAPAALRLQVMAKGLCADEAGQVSVRSVVGRVMDGAPRGEIGVLDPLISCGACPACLRGQTNFCAHLETLYDRLADGTDPLDVPATAFARLPHGLGPQAACLIEPLARGWHRARLTRRAFPQGRSVLVIGDTADAVGAALSLRAQGIDAPHLAPMTPDCRAVLSQRSRLALRDPAALTGQTYDLVLNFAGPDHDAFAQSLMGSEGALARGRCDRAAKLHSGIRDVQTWGYSAQDFTHVANAAAEGRLGRLGWFETAPLVGATPPAAGPAFSPTSPMTVLKAA